MNYSVLIADDHPIFRSGIREIVRCMEGLQLTAEARDGMEAYQMILSKRPDIAILDLDMPVLTGLEVCRKVLQEKHSTRFIILTMHKERDFFQAAMAAGVAGYLLKDHAIEELIACIRAVGQGRQYVSASLDKYLVERQAVQSMPPNIAERIQNLTATEKVILKLISQGHSSNEIAGQLFISSNTVDNHRANMARKLLLEGKNSLLKFALHYAPAL